MTNEAIPNLTAFDEAALDRAFASLEAQARADASAFEAEPFRLKWLGRRQGLLNEVSGQWLKAAPPEAKKAVGQRFKVLKELVEGLLEGASGAGPTDAALRVEAIDITLPGTRRLTGAEHPIVRTMNEIVSVFSALGYSVGVGPEVETDYYNFESMNFPPGHPARDTQDTLVVASQERRPSRDRLLLRTHTSPVQIRTMQNEPPPIYVIAPGRTYRSDYDATHTPMFHQIEGLVMDKHTHMGHLKGCLEEFCRLFFEDPSLKLRFRPGYFPFTEPSAEVDIWWKGSSWLEILGCGMVHPNVLRNCDIDPKEYQGFAFGMGLERIAMLKYGIEDLRLFFESDLRWLNHYGFAPEARE